jgi:hypothetical protein
MMFKTQTDAKRFIIDKVLEQAKIEGVNLSEVERYNLSWSESDPDFKPDYYLSEALETEIGIDKYEAKVASLIKHAFERDVAAHFDAKSLYREVYAKLNEGDHYIIVMMKSALGLKLSKWWTF